MFSTDTKIVRRRRRELIGFLDSLTLFLSVGYDLAYGWQESVRMLGKSGLEILHRTLSSEGMGITSHLERLARAYPDVDSRPWFAVIKDIYLRGAPMTPLIRTAADALRREEERDFQNHCRTLPTRIHTLLIIFFLPPALAFLTLPLLVFLDRL
jgi:hypothetical protein